MFVCLIAIFHSTCLNTYFDNGHILILINFMHLLARVCRSNYLREFISKTPFPWLYVVGSKTQHSFIQLQKKQ